MTEGGQLDTFRNLPSAPSTDFCRWVTNWFPCISVVETEVNQLSKRKCCSTYLGSAWRWKCCLMYQRKWCCGRNRGAHKARSCQHCEHKTGHHSCSVLLACFLSSNTITKMLDGDSCFHEWPFIESHTVQALRFSSISLASLLIIKNMELNRKYLQNRSDKEDFTWMTEWFWGCRQLVCLTSWQ